MILSNDESGALAVALARVEGKIDAYSARTSAVEEMVAELDRRIRTTATEDEVRAIEDRLRSVETRHVVTPTGLAATLATTVTVLGGTAVLLDRLYI